MLDGYGPIPPSMARRLVADGADSFHRVLVDPRDGAPLEIGTDQLPPHEDHAPMAPAPRRPVPVPGLQQPVPGQRRRPPPGLGRRRHHRDHQPRPALPQTPPPQTQFSLDTERGQQRQTTRLDLTRQDATIPANSRTGNHPTGHPASRPPKRSRTHFWIQACPRLQAGIPPWTCPRIQAGIRRRTPSLTGTYSRPDTNSPPRTWRICPGQSPSRTLSRNGFCPNLRVDQLPIVLTRQSHQIGGTRDLGALEFHALLFAARADADAGSGGGGAVSLRPPRTP